MSLPPLCLNPIIVFPLLPFPSQSEPTGDSKVVSAPASASLSSCTSHSLPGLPFFLKYACLHPATGPLHCSSLWSRAVEASNSFACVTHPPLEFFCHRLSQNCIPSLQCTPAFAVMESESLLDGCFVFPTSPHVLGGLTMFFSCIVSPAPCLAHSRHLTTI